jgi:hypothetical protein
MLFPSKSAADQLLTPSWEKRGPFGLPRRQKVVAQPEPETIEPLYPGNRPTQRVENPPTAPQPRPAAPAPARLPYSHPTRRAEREVQRAKAKVQHAERTAKYIKEGVDPAEAERRARYDLYQEITRAS